MIALRSMTQSRYHFSVELAAMLLLLAYPMLMLAVRGGMNAVLLFMLLLAVMTAIIRPKGINAIVWQREWTAYTIAMFAIPIAIFISQSFNQYYTAHPYDSASRYFLVIPMFLMLQRLRSNVFVVLQFAFPVAAVVGLLMAKDLGEGRMGIPTLDLIHYGDFELLLGVLSLFSLHWFSRDNLPMRFLKIAGFIAGLSASFASGSRGGWLAIPLFIVIFIYFRTNRVQPRVILSSVIAAMLTFALLFSFNSTVNQRVHELTNDVTVFSQGNRDTSMGIRWQLYHAAVDVFLDHPIFGVGVEGFAQEMKQMTEAGKITPFAAELGRGEVHNDILSKAVGMGVFGLMAILAIYFVPFRLFWRATQSASAHVRRSGILGITFVGGFFVFGLTVEILNLTMAAAFYSFTVAVLLAACYNTQFLTVPQPQ
ncbi:MAG: O-antigen ligase family protein [Gallionella sp.]|nr:O-antigen ligase family protein [Gallionella sp.]